MIVLSIVTLVISLVLCGILIKYIRSINAVQPIYDEAPEQHQKKAGTPTMGGLSICLTILIMLNLICLLPIFNIDNSYSYMVLFDVIILGYGFIGFRDDFLKIKFNANQSGLTPIQKLGLQFLVSAIIIITLYVVNIPTTIDIFGLGIDLNIIYYVLVPIMIVGYSNATNLTDGLDGLLGTTSIISFSFLGYYAYMIGAYDILVFDIIIIFSILGFLYFNLNPAKIFMGDTGSLVIGSLFALNCILLKVEIFSVLFGIVFLIEMFSVIIQVGYFKYTKKKTGTGRRVFKMAPLHHDLEQRQFSEVKVVLILGIIQIIGCVVATILLLGV